MNIIPVGKIGIVCGIVTLQSLLNSVMEANSTQHTVVMSWTSLLAFFVHWTTTLTHTSIWGGGGGNDSNMILFLAQEVQAL